MRLTAPRRLSASPLCPRGIHWRVTDQLCIHQAGDEQFLPVIVKIDRGPFGV